MGERERENGVGVALTCFRRSDEDKREIER